MSALVSRGQGADVGTPQQCPGVSPEGLLPPRWGTALPALHSILLPDLTLRLTKPGD